MKHTVYLKEPRSCKNDGVRRGCVKERGGRSEAQEDVRGPTRGSAGSSVLHNLCRYILYVCRYIAKYISMANESNLKRVDGRDGRGIVRRAGKGRTRCIVYFLSRLPRANHPCFLGKVGRNRTVRNRGWEGNSPSSVLSSECVSIASIFHIKNKKNLDFRLLSANLPEICLPRRASNRNSI